MYKRESRIYHEPSGRWLTKKELYKLIFRRVRNYLKEKNIKEFRVVKDVPQFELWEKIAKDLGIGYETVERKDPVIEFLKKSRGLIFLYCLEDFLNIFIALVNEKALNCFRKNFFPFSVISINEIQYFCNFSRVYTRYDKYLRRLSEISKNIFFSFLKGINYLEALIKDC